MRVSWLKSKSGSSSHTDGSVQGRAALSTLWLSISRPRRGVTPPPHLQICTVDSKYDLTLKFFLLLVYGLVPPVTCVSCPVSLIRHASFRFHPEKKFLIQPDPDSQHCSWPFGLSSTLFEPGSQLSQINENSFRIRPLVFTENCHKKAKGRQNIGSGRLVFLV